MGLGRRFGGFRLFAHTILGGEKFRVEPVLRVCKSRNGFPNIYETEETAGLTSVYDEQPFANTVSSSLGGAPCRRLGVSPRSASFARPSSFARVPCASLCAVRATTASSASRTARSRRGASAISPPARMSPPRLPSPAELGPAWVVRRLSGSDGDGCPVDALALLPPCIAHPSGAVAVAHGGVDADVVGVGGYVPRPARVAVLDLDTGREIRLLTLPMSWPNGGVCPVASLVPAGAEGGVVAVSAARVYRVGEGASGFQGSFACLAAWSGASPVPVAVIPVGPQHTPALGPDPSFESTGRLRKPRARLPSAPILEPFAGLSSSSAPRDDGGEGVVVILRSAHVVLETSTGVLRACPMEWRLAKPAAPLGVALRPTRHVEFASALVGARSTMETLRVEAARAANDTLPDFPEANTPAPAVATWWWGMAAAWDGCEPRAKTWRFGTATTPNDFEEQPAASAALDACARGARRRVANLVPMPNIGRVLALTRDVSALHDVPRLFVTRAGDPREGGAKALGGGGQPRAGGDDASDDNESRAAESRAAAEDAEDASSASAPPLPADDSEPCPICLDPPGAGGDEDDDFSLARDVAAISSRVVHAPCCRAAFCRGCLRDYLAAFPRRGCPHCRDVDAFLRGEDVADVAAAERRRRAVSRNLARHRTRRGDRRRRGNERRRRLFVASALVTSAALVGDVSDDFYVRLRRWRPTLRRPTLRRVVRRFPTRTRGERDGGESRSNLAGGGVVRRRGENLRGRVARASRQANGGRGRRQRSVGGVDDAGRDCVRRGRRGARRAVSRREVNESSM